MRAVRQEKTIKLKIMEKNVYGLVGKDISYSFSKGYFTDKFSDLKLDAHSYENFDLGSISEFPDMLLTHPDIRGLNVTIPYKQEIIPYLDTLDAQALQIGAVNTIEFKENKRIGHNTDAYGFRNSIETHIRPHHKKALILGTGGASKAIAYVLGQLAIDFIYVSRNPSVNRIGYSDVNEDILKTHTVLINCTPLGTHPNVDQKPNIPYNLLSKDHLLFDLIYNPSETAFLAAGKEKGATTVNGLRMLELQADRSWEIWSGTVKGINPNVEAQASPEGKLHEDKQGDVRDSSTDETSEITEVDPSTDTETGKTIGNNENVPKENAHQIRIKDYSDMSMENLVGEFQRLIRTEDVQHIKKHIAKIKSEFDQKFDDFIEGKKEKFIEEGGSEIDFQYNSTTKRQFNELYKEYREKRNQHRKNQEKVLKENLAKRLAVIEELKGLTSVEESMGTTYKTFKELQQKWRKLGPIPRDSYDNVWRTYRHHTEIFYDYLSLNRELRDLDFKHNLEEKEKLVTRAEALADEPNINRVFRELQALHKIWKEDIGPVGKEHREDVWERFSKATKVLHDKRQLHFKELDREYERNLEKKREIIASITKLAENTAENHRELQKQMKAMEQHRQNFFATGKVPKKQNEKTWSAFKQAVRSFNRQKNSFYKAQKQEQYDNLAKKRELLEKAHQLKESEDFEATTPEMKRIQAEWKKIGHVPRKNSDKIWKEFKKACNHYFDRLHALKNKGREEEEANYKRKLVQIDRLAAFESSGEREADLEALKEMIETYKSFGPVPFKKKNIAKKFEAVLDANFKKIGIDRKQAELLKYGNKIQRLADSDNDYALEKERNFIRKKIEETKGEIRQLETNLEFFSNASEDNPLVRDVVSKVAEQKKSLGIWEAKLKELNIMKNSIQREAEALEADKKDTADSGSHSAATDEAEGTKSR